MSVLETDIFPNLSLQRSNHLIDNRKDRHASTRRACVCAAQITRYGELISNGPAVHNH